jgi:hypothetical protein
VVGRYRGAVWAYTLMCPDSCPTHADAVAAHKVAAEAARRAGTAVDEKLIYTAVDSSSGVAGVVRGRR